MGSGGTRGAVRRRRRRRRRRGENEAWKTRQEGRFRRGRAGWERLGETPQSRRRRFERASDAVRRLERVLVFSVVAVAVGLSRRERWSRACWSRR